MSKAAMMLTVALLSANQVTSGQSFSGEYRIAGNGQSVELTIRQNTDGSLSGRLLGAGVALELAGMIEAPGISGTLEGGSSRFGFVALLCEQGDHLNLKLYEFDAGGRPNYQASQILVFERVGSPSVLPTNARGDGGQSDVFINRRRLSAADRAAIERQYGTRIPDGRYWYDARSGAWGVEGGPTSGFTLAGLNLPGPMPADISGGGTGIFVNGRELHSVDQMALYQLLGVTYPGRYWLDARGNLGIEGGPMLVNLLQVSQQQAGSQYGSVYSEVGNTRSTVASDGSGGFMFMSSDGTSWHSGQ